MARNGKIARMPQEIRLELNRRLMNGEQGKRLVAWLNGLAEVREMLASDFGGRAVSEQNLSEWRHGGYREWVGRKELLEKTGSPGAPADCKSAALSSEDMLYELTEQLAGVVAARYAAVLMEMKKGMTRKWVKEFRFVRGIIAEVAELRRGNHRIKRMELEWEILKIKAIKPNQTKKISKEVSEPPIEQGLSTGQQTNELVRGEKDFARSERVDMSCHFHGTGEIEIESESGRGLPQSKSWRNRDVPSGCSALRNSISRSVFGSVVGWRVHGFTKKEKAEPPDVGCYEVQKTMGIRRCRARYYAGGGLRCHLPGNSTFLELLQVGPEGLEIGIF